MFLRAPEAAVVDVVVVVDMDVVTVIRLVEMEIIPSNMLARASDPVEEGKGEFRQSVTLYLEANARVPRAKKFAGRTSLKPKAEQAHPSM